MPDDFVAEALVAEEFVQFHFEVVGGVPIAVPIEASRHFEQAAAFEQAGVPPSQIARQALLSYIGKTALLAVFPSRDAILFLAKERRIGVNQIHALRRQRAHYLQIVAAKDSDGEQIRMPQFYSLSHLKRQANIREDFAETLALVPTYRLFFHRHGAKSSRRLPEAFVIWQLPPLLLRHRLLRCLAPLALLRLAAASFSFLLLLPTAIFPFHRPVGMIFQA